MTRYPADQQSWIGLLRLVRTAFLLLVLCLLPACSKNAQRLVKPLTNEFIASAEHESLCEEAFDVIPTDNVRQVPRPWRVVHTVYWLHLEITHDGFEEFFDRSNHGLIDETEEDLGLIGALQYQGLFSGARTISDTQSPDRNKRLAAVTEAFDRQYQEKSLTDYLAAYIKAHQKAFVR